MKKLLFVCALAALVLPAAASASKPKQLAQSCKAVLPPAVLRSVTGLATTVKYAPGTAASGCEYFAGTQKVLDFYLYPNNASFYDYKWKNTVKGAAAFAQRDPNCAAGTTWGPSECTPTQISGLGTRADTSNIGFLMQKGSRLAFFETWWKDTNRFGDGILISTEQMQTLMRGMLPRIK